MCYHDRYSMIHNSHERKTTQCQLMNKWTKKCKVYTYTHFSGGSVVKNLPMQEMGGWSLDWEDLLEKEKATYSYILVWEIPWTEEPGGLQFTRSKRIWPNRVYMHGARCCIYEISCDVQKWSFLNIYIFWNLGKIYLAHYTHNKMFCNLNTSCRKMQKQVCYTS